MLKLDAYKLKWIAIIGMFANHAVIAWWEIIPTWLALPLYAAGGLTFPIMAYFVVEGYKHTTNLRRYMLRLFIFGLIAVPFHILTLGTQLGNGYPVLNIMFTIILSLIVLVLYDKIKYRWLFWIIYVLLIIPASLLFEWSFPGVTMVLLFYIIKNEKMRRIFPPIGAILLNMALALVFLIPGVEMPDKTGLLADPNFVTVSGIFVLGILLSSVLLLFYNNERGKRMKWLFYAFYPIHLAVLAAVALALGLISLSVFGF